MENKKVVIRCTVPGELTIKDPTNVFNSQYRWAGPGAIRSIDLDVLKELYYMPGVEAMFQTGMLYIDDMEVKKELGIEPEEAEKPVNVIVLDDKQRQRYLSVAPLRDLQEVCKTLSPQELDNLVQYAIDHEITNYDKSDFLKKLTGRDIIKSIELNRADKND